MNLESLSFLDISEGEITDRINTWVVRHENSMDNRYYNPQDIFETDLLYNHAYKNGRSIPPWIHDIHIIHTYSGDTEDMYDMKDAFKPQYNERACARLTIAKEMYVKKARNQISVKVECQKMTLDLLT